MGKLPAFQFYPNDWRTDPELCRCSKSARDTWMDMLCLMFFCEERGVLATAGVPWTDEDVAAAVRGPLDANLADIRELVAKGVALRRSGDGALYSKRMARDDHERKANAKRQQRFRSHGRNNAPLTPMSEEEEEGEVRGFRGFDSEESKPEGRSPNTPVTAMSGESLYELFRQAHPRSTGSAAEQHAFLEACGQKQAKAREIIAAAKLYASASASGLLGHSPARADNWLRDKIFNENPELWRKQDGRSAKKQRDARAIQEAAASLAE